MNKNLKLQVQFVNSVYLKLILITSFHLLFQISNCYSQFDAFEMKKFNPPANISLNSVSCSLVDDEGFIWLGTHDGLMRYDGFDFRIIKHNSIGSTSLGGTLVTSISSYGDSLIIGFKGAGIDILDNKTGKIHHYNSGNSKEI